jgi:SAM-dependent methyltransferase
LPTVTETERYWDENAAEYDRGTGFGFQSGQEYNWSRYYRPFFEASVPQKGRVLELGCGTGFYTRWLADRGLEVVAMDLSPNMVEAAKKRCPPSVSFFVGDCEKPETTLTPEATAGGFDAIVGVNTFSYYAHKEEALASYWKLLRPGGRLVFLDMNGTAYTQEIAYLLDYRGAGQFKREIRQMKPAFLRRILERQGFAIQTLDRFTFMPNAATGLALHTIAPLERLLGHLPLVRALAVRISVVATKVEPRGQV